MIYSTLTVIMYSKTTPNREPGLMINDRHLVVCIEAMADQIKSQLTASAQLSTNTHRLQTNILDSYNDSFLLFYDRWSPFSLSFAV